MRCTVFGTGYLGATHAAGMAELGHDVVGVDIDPGKVAKLAGGDIPFYEPGLRKMLADNLAAADCGSAPTMTWPPTSPMCTFSVSARRKRRANTVPTCATCMQSSTRSCRG
ncbi:UDP-glucose/GDP-mannose dehydrogenase family, NAD binding domain protein [Mycobacterium xenopi 3993]|nr:UDP-glucose/GDP-mannose dehydrogenase family, NAD binding domain protein [Mycobacterium xenopi 3993]